MSDRIQIVVRVRPFAKHEKGMDNIIDMEGNKTMLTNPDSGDVKDFSFARSFWSHDDSKGGIVTNTGVFEDIGKEVLENAYQGFNATLFAYGQTGSGKTTTIMGSMEPPAERGLLLRLMLRLLL